jgi:hypothetical protein
MAHDGEQGRAAGRPAEVRAERTAEESARSAWAKPALHRFSLQRTLSGSGVASDGSKAVSAFPT